MPIFSFKAKNLSGQIIENQREAADLSALADSLKKEGYFLLSSSKKGQGGAKTKFFSFFGRISIREKMVFARNLAVMVGAGVSLVKGLNILSRQTENTSWKNLIEKMAEEIKRGHPLSQAMEEHSKVFSPLFRSMVKAGETSGKLDESLRLVALQLERDYELKRKVRGAFVYPAIILSAMVIIGILMLVYVVPTLTATFEELEVELPLMTKIIVELSSFITNRWILTSVLAVSFLASIILLARSQSGKRVLANALLRTPVISGILKKVNAARISRTLSSLVSSGVEIIEALEITEAVAQNHRFKNVLVLARAEIQKGNPVSGAFIENRDLFPLLVGEMMAVGEETGKFSEMLVRVADFYEEDVAEATKNLSTVIEPVLMLVIGAIVGLFAVSMIQPLYSLTSGL